MTAEERLVAYVDGELGPGEAARFEVEIADNPALAKAVAAHRGMAARLSQTYDPVLDEPVPAHMKALAAASDRSPPVNRLSAWAAIAASLLIGVALGRLAPPDPGPLVSKDGALVARGDLRQALDQGLASEPGPIRIGLTFRAADGGYCRTFESPTDQLAGLACRREDRWIATVTTVATPAATPEYHTAASAMSPAVLAAVDASIVGAPLGAAAERQARDSGWKP